MANDIVHYQMQWPWEKVLYNTFLFVLVVGQFFFVPKPYRINYEKIFCYLLFSA